MTPPGTPSDVQPRPRWRVPTAVWGLLLVIGMLACVAGLIWCWGGLYHTWCDLDPSCAWERNDRSR